MIIIYELDRFNHPFVSPIFLRLGAPMTTATMKITQKGRVTIPKEVRKILNTDFVYFEMENDTVIIKPVRDAAGSLREFAWNIKQRLSRKQIQDKAWHDAIRDKIGEQSRTELSAY